MLVLQLSQQAGRRNRREARAIRRIDTTRSTARHQTFQYGVHIGTWDTGSFCQLVSIALARVNQTDIGLGFVIVEAQVTKEREDRHGETQ